MAKQKKEKPENPNEKVNKAEYNIVLLEKLGGTVRVIKSFLAVRWIDEEDHVVYLKSSDSKLNFMEIFPQQINDFKNYTEDQVDKLINKYTTTLEREKDEDTQLNDKDLEFELLKLRAKKRSFTFSESSSYLSFDDKARPTFYFLREGSTFFPFKWDTDTKNIFVPSDNRKKSASIALRNKENKYKTEKLITGSAVLMIIIGIIFLGGGSYMLFKGKGAMDESFQKYDASEIAKSQRACLENINSIAASVAQSAKDVQVITTSIEEDLNKPQTIISGVIPE